MTIEEAKKILACRGNSYSEEDFNSAIEVAFNCIPSLPSNLDEAAEEYCSKCREKGFHLSPYSAFRAGAEWMARQGETIEGEILTTSDYGWETIRIPKKLYPLGTKVTIQIRKK